MARSRERIGAMLQVATLSIKQRRARSLLSMGRDLAQARHLLGPAFAAWAVQEFGDLDVAAALAVFDAFAGGNRFDKLSLFHPSTIVAVAKAPASVRDEVLDLVGAMYLTDGEILDYLEPPLAIAAE
jgi:hypothetical protein